MSIESRLAELGVTLPTPWSPVANYVPARLNGDHLYLSGHVARRDGSVLVGRFGGDLSSDAAADIAIPKLRAISRPFGLVKAIDRATGHEQRAARTALATVEAWHSERNQYPYRD